MPAELRGMLLAAGLGRRLRPLTHFLPKPSVPLLNRPLALYALDLFRTADVKKIAVNLHHMPESVQQSLSGEAESFLYSYEDPILGTAGGIGKIRDFFDTDTLVVVNGKIYFEENLNRVIEHHRKKGSAVTMVLVPLTPRDRFNPVLVDAGGNIVAFARSSRDWTEASSFGSRPDRELSPYIFTGIHILEKEVLEFIPEGRSDTVMDIYPLLMERGYPVRGFVSSGFWREFSTPERYLRNSLELLDRKGLKDASLSTLPASCRRVVAGAQVRISEGAKVEHSVLWDDVTISSGCSLRNVVVVGGVQLPKNTSVEDAIVTPFQAGLQDQIAESAKMIDSNVIWPLTSD